MVCTNGGLKYGYFAVKSNMTISKSTSNIIRQDESKSSETVRLAHNHFSKTKLYDLHREGIAEANKVVPNALGEMKEQII